MGQYIQATASRVRRTEFHLDHRLHRSFLRGSQTQIALRLRAQVILVREGSEGWSPKQAVRSHGLPAPKGGGGVTPIPATLLLLLRGHAGLLVSHRTDLEVRSGGPTREETPRRARVPIGAGGRLLRQNEVDQNSISLAESWIMYVET